MNKILFFIMVFASISNTIFAQHNAYLEKFKFDNFHNIDQDLIKKSLIKEYKISEIKEYHTSQKITKNQGKTQWDTVYKTSYIFDKEAALLKIVTINDSTLYEYNGNVLTKSTYFFPHHGADLTYNYFVSVPILMTIEEDSSYKKNIFNNDSLLVRAEQYDTNNELTRYTEYNYYNDYVERNYFNFSTEDKNTSKKDYIYFTPDCGVLFTMLKKNPNGIGIDYVIFARYNNDTKQKLESVSYYGFRQSRITYHYDERGLLVLKKYYKDEVLTNEILYKYIVD